MTDGSMCEKFGVSLKEVEEWAKQKGLDKYPLEIKVASYLKQVKNSSIPDWLAQFKEELVVPVSELKVSCRAYIQVYVASDINKITWQGCGICKRKLAPGNMTCIEHPDAEVRELVRTTYLAGDTSGSIPIDIPNWAPFGMTGEVGDRDFVGKTLLLWGFVRDNGNFGVISVLKMLDGAQANAEVRQDLAKPIAQPKVIEIDAKPLVETTNDVQIAPEVRARFIKMLNLLGDSISAKELEGWLKRNNIQLSVEAFVEGLKDVLTEVADGRYKLLGD